MSQLLDQQFDNQCQICFEEYNDKNVVPYLISPCGHPYCKGCLDKLDSNKCPSCRNPIIHKIKNFLALNLLYNNVERTSAFNNKQLNESKEVKKLLNKFESSLAKVEEIHTETKEKLKAIKKANGAKPKANKVKEWNELLKTILNKMKELNLDVNTYQVDLSNNTKDKVKPVNFAFNFASTALSSKILVNESSSDSEDSDSSDSSNSEDSSFESTDDFRYFIEDWNPKPKPPKPKFDPTQYFQDSHFQFFPTQTKYISPPQSKDIIDAYRPKRLDEQRAWELPQTRKPMLQYIDPPQSRGQNAWQKRLDELYRIWELPQTRKPMLVGYVKRNGREVYIGPRRGVFSVRESGSKDYSQVITEQGVYLI